MKKTKIICTMGPNADNEETLRALIENGMDVDEALQAAQDVVDLEQ